MSVAAVPNEQRKKWAEQIRQTVEQLHEFGVVWGDGKPNNVLIHTETNDCWLVDFGSSWTDGWVDAELNETNAGDKQAVVKIIEFLAC
jgi:serine/threonine protein kinase